MIPLCYAILCATAAAYSPEFFGSVGESSQTFTLRHLKSGEEYRGALWDRETYLSSLNDSATPGRRLRLVLDTPWAPAAFDIRASDYEIVNESNRLRVNRLEEGWKEAGYELIEAPGMGMFPIVATEKERADRARLLVAERNRAAQGALFDAQAKLPEIRIDHNADPDFFQLWGGHLAVVIAGVLAVAGVWYYIVIRF